jgi:hypothetical protein
MDFRLRGNCLFAILLIVSCAPGSGTPRLEPPVAEGETTAITGVSVIPMEARVGPTARAASPRVEGLG